MRLKELRRICAVCHMQAAVKREAGKMRGTALGHSRESGNPAPSKSQQRHWIPDRRRAASGMTRWNIAVAWRVYVTSHRTRADHVVARLADSRFRRARIRIADRARANRH